MRDDGAIIGELNRHGVPHVLVGGWAVIAHGYVRATRDIDVLIPDTSEARERTIAALLALDAVTLNGQRVTAESRISEGGIRVRTTHGELDVLLEGDTPLSYAELAASAHTADIGGVEVHVVDLAHLAAMKRLAGRPQDQLDLDALAAIHGPLPEPPR